MITTLPYYLIAQSQLFVPSFCFEFVIITRVALSGGPITWGPAHRKAFPNYRTQQVPHKKEAGEGVLETNINISSPSPSHPRTLARLRAFLNTIKRNTEHTKNKRSDKKKGKKETTKEEKAKQGNKTSACSFFLLLSCFLVLCFLLFLVFLVGLRTERTPFRKLL